MFSNKESKLNNEQEQHAIKRFPQIDTDDILIKIEKDKDLSYITTAFWILLSSNLDLKIRTAKTLNNTINSIPISQLPKIDLMFRERTSFEWFYNWKDEDPYNLIDPSLSDEEMITVFGLASFHPNGYFREKAINALSSMTTGYEIPYLIIRLNDWVEIVRKTAKRAFIERINARYLKNIVDNLP